MTNLFKKLFSYKKFFKETFMKFKIFIATIIAFMVIMFGNLYAGDKCVNCSSSSPCQQCKLDGGVDNQKNRKKCEDLGCKIVGTGSCSTAANVKVCNK